MWRRSSLLLVAALGACHPTAPTPTPSDASTPAPAEAGAMVGADAGPGPAWPDAIRAADYPAAAQALAALPPGEQTKPEVRLARAKVALATKDAAGALTALEKLDDQLPLLHDLVARMRAQAQFEIGPYDKAAEQFATKHDTLILAAEAWDKAGDNTKARAAWERVIFEKHGRAQEIKARTRRMQITRLKDGDAAAAADARWLAINAADEKVFSEAADILEKLTPPKLLTAEELLARSRMLAEEGRTEEALHVVDRAATRGNLPIDFCRTKAEALWKARTRYAEAALAYRNCSNMGGPHAAEDAFLSARAFSRADREGDAIPAFQSVIQHFARTSWADEAEYHLARTHALAGHWKEAASAFDDYIKHWPSGKEKREAQRYRAIAYLNDHNDKRARKLLEELAGGAEDANASARWTNLAALAALRDGDRLHAISRWSEVARSRPLTWPALVARARLKENGAPLPTTIEPAESGSLEPLPVELPPPVDMLHRIGFEAEGEQELREREAGIIGKAPSRSTEALCSAYALLDRAKRRFQLSQQVPGAALTTAPGGRNRALWDCVYPRPYDGVARDAATRAKLDADLLWAVMRQESGFDPEVVSPARAVGLMQLLPETAKATATTASMPYEDAWLVSPPRNIQLGALYLRELLDKFSENVALAVAAYNGGPESISRWLSHAKGESLDVFVEAIPFVETRGYVARVLGNLARYGYLDRGESGVPNIALDLK